MQPHYMYEILVAMYEYMLCWYILLKSYLDDQDTAALDEQIMEYIHRR